MSKEKCKHKDIVPSSHPAYWYNCTDCGAHLNKRFEEIPSVDEEIDKSEWKTKNPKMFEYDSNNNIVDVFVRKDDRCPFPFHEEDWWHQGLYLEEFRLYLNLFFERYDLPYRVKYYEEI